MRKTAIGCGVAVLALFGGLTAAGPAGAAAAAANEIYLGDATLAPGATSDANALYVNFDSDFLFVQNATVTYDYSKAAGVVGITSDDEDWDSCTAGTGKLNCKLSEWELYDGSDVLPTVALNAPANAKVGASGTVTVTMTDAATGTLTTASRVRVAEAVDLVAGAAQKATAAVNGTFDQKVSVRNGGKKAVTGVVAVFGGTNNVVDDETDYANCNYDADGVAVSCAFDDTLAVGRTYTATIPMLVGAAAMAPGRQRSEITWMTPAEAEDAIDEDDAGEPGEGDPLVLTEAKGVRAGEQADANPDNNTSVTDVTVTGKNGADVAVAGSTATGKVGSTVELELTYTNNGPADLETTDENLAVTAVDVTLPQGTSIVGDPDQGCELLEGSTYRCYAFGALLAVGESEWCAFQVRVDRIVPNGAGRVSLVTDDEFVLHKSDTNAANNSAQLVVKGS
ncbi:hypothetical protein GCM10010124_32880 [Pilimelia terevasa]|uniref:DUF11 domain-containing protein n=1 Tax=Pilimelia terevasa TaxID=53372 RepID=A0A8J3FJ66_9ACTN|nr:DUF11 domain-containing protein [Pilimelia terevasa]GGK37506.1 hypothetical protein GCM10010124_32880 [Pilimelia terevasa]